MKIFVAHYTKLVPRKEFMLYQFAKQNITDFEFIEVYDREDICENDAQIFGNKMNPALISLSLKHHYIYKKVAESDDYENCLILEDDAILYDNFKELLDGYMLQLPNTYDALFIGDGCGRHIEDDKIMPNKNIYEKCIYPEYGNEGSKCTDSYVISKKCARKLCNYINNLTYIDQPIDRWLNVAFRDTECHVYWAEPTIVTQGSQKGNFKSSLDDYRN